MEAAIADRKPVGRVCRRILRQNHINRAIVILLQPRTVIDTVAVDWIINQEIVVTVCGDRPKTAVKNLRIALKVELIGVFSK